MWNTIHLAGKGGGMKQTNKKQQQNEPVHLRLNPIERECHQECETIPLPHL